MKAIHNAYINRETKNAARNEREEMFEEMKPLLASLIESAYDSNTSKKELKVIYAGVKMKALTIITAHNNRRGNVVRFKPDYFERMIRSFISDNLTSTKAEHKAVIKGLMPLLPVKFRMKCWWRRLTS